MAVLSAHCPRLADVDLSGCLRMRGWGLVSLAGEGSLWEGRLSRLRLADTPALAAAGLRALLDRAVRTARCAALVGVRVNEQVHPSQTGLAGAGLRTLLDRAVCGARPW